MLKKINGKFQKLGGVMTPLGTPPNSAYGYKILDKDYMILVYILISFFFFFCSSKIKFKVPYLMIRDFIYLVNSHPHICM